MNHTLAVGVGHRLANVNEMLEKRAEAKRRGLIVIGIDGFREGSPFDEAHGVIGPAFLVFLERVNRNDAGMLKLSSDLRFRDEALAQGSVVEAVGPNFL